MVYSWTVRLPDETKIADAYQMLKKQGEPMQKPENATNQQVEGQVHQFELSHFPNGYLHCVVFHTLILQTEVYECLFFFSSHISHMNMLWFLLYPYPTI